MPENRHSVDKANPTTDGLMPEVELLRYGTRSDDLCTSYTTDHVIIPKFPGDVARTVARMLYFVKNNAQHHYVFDTPASDSSSPRSLKCTDRLVTRTLTRILLCRIVTGSQYYCAGWTAYVGTKY